ncbi:uroporphyrinogen-III C-methyltransferase [Salicibibacter halophilus]|uniref:Uroporphyrinogen-III C-methyltransferase n=1 Tax=Salicibibacter halophilus TaxID=2502791 RepID=A0A514LNV6_9BACI|nr:uroporphyrinogen-III C-methyltransferase [Salicibibacter halophilus]
MSEQGMVYLVGAGPGDTELLTVKGQRVLREADVVIFDRLINPYLLTEIKNNAKLVYCGKQPCNHMLRQEDIQSEMLIHAKKGKTVVRLKGGDPTVFGRVGEEAADLKANGVNFEVVPGVTSGIAASTYAGVPVTHRDYSGSFAVVTGHRRTDDGKPDVNWDSLAKSVDTILFYMGVQQIETIVSKLMQHGKAKETPVLVIQWGSYTRQRSVEGDLTTISKKIENQKIKNPAIILVGDVIHAREQVNWFEHKPLSGMGILVRSDEKKELLKHHGADVYIRNLTTTGQEIDQALEAGKDQALVFSNGKVIRAFLAALGERGHDVRNLRSTLVAADEHIKKEFFKLGMQVRLFSEKTWMTPIFLGQSQTQGEKVAEERLIKEGHVNAVVCSGKEEVDDLASETLHFFTTNQDVEHYARSLGLKSTPINFRESEEAIIAQFTGTQSKGAVLQ